MSTRKPEVLYRAIKDGVSVELTRGSGRLSLVTTGSSGSSAISILDPWYTPTPRIPARPS